MARRTKLEIFREKKIDQLTNLCIQGLQLPIMELGNIHKRATALRSSDRI